MGWDEGLHPRHPGGSPLGGQFRSKGLPPGMLARIQEPDGGFSYQPLTGDEPRDGFMVFELTFMDMARYVAKHRTMLRDRSNYLGAWHDPATGKVFFDISRRVTSRGEAHRLAARHDQIAYFDLGAGKSVTVNASATSGGVA